MISDESTSVLLNACGWTGITNVTLPLNYTCCVSFTTDIVYFSFAHVCVCDVFTLQARAELSGRTYYMRLITVVKPVASLKKSFAAGTKKGKKISKYTHTHKITIVLVCVFIKSHHLCSLIVWESDDMKLKMFTLNYGWRARREIYWRLNRCIWRKVEYLFLLEKRHVTHNSAHFGAVLSNRSRRVLSYSGDGKLNSFENTSDESRISRISPLCDVDGPHKLYLH